MTKCVPEVAGARVRPRKVGPWSNSLQVDPERWDGPRLLLARPGPDRLRGMSIPPALRDFVELVNRGEYWESHEVLEGPWREHRSDFLQGLILYASAFVHARRGNRHGIQAQLRKARDKLAGYPSAYLGVDVEALRGHMRRCQAVVEAHPDADPGDWPNLIPFPVLELSPARVRGDEPEGSPP